MIAGFAISSPKNSPLCEKIRVLTGLSDQIYSLDRSFCNYLIFRLSKEIYSVISSAINIITLIED